MDTVFIEAPLASTMFTRNCIKAITAHDHVYVRVCNDVETNVVRYAIERHSTVVVEVTDLKRHFHN